jgi:hypothetical protein
MNTLIQNLKLTVVVVFLFLSVTPAFSQSWSPIGGGTNWEYSLVVYNNELYAGEQSGNGGHGLKKFNGTTWSDLGAINGTVNALAVYNGNLIVGGSFTLAGGLDMSNIAQWDGVTWSDVSGGPNSIVSALTVYNGDLIVGGYFTMVENMNANHIAKWNNNGGWAPLGSGINSQVMALTTYNNKLIAGGFFTTAGGGSASHIAQWDGSGWFSLGSGINNIVYGLASGNGKLYAGGLFSSAGGISAQGIASWDGELWSNLGTGCSGGLYPYVFSITVHGTDVYSAGLYTIAGGQTCNGIAKWNGTSWSPLGSGFWSGGSNVYGAYSSCIYNGNLVCGGIFSSAGGTGAGNVAQWNGLLTGVNNNQIAPDKFELSQNYPNPFNPTTKISFSIPKSETVNLTVYDASGKAAVLLVNEHMNAGTHEITFNASEFSSGVYFYTIKTNSFSSTKKMVLTK